MLALPAFRLHQHIAYGSTFGEYFHTFGLKAYLTTLLLWWATWAIGVATSAALLRVGWRPSRSWPRFFARSRPSTPAT